MTRQNTRIDQYKEGYQNRPLLHKLSYQQRLKRYLENTAVIPSTAFQTLVDYDGYSISSKGFLPTVVDLMVI